MLILIFKGVTLAVILTLFSSLILTAFVCQYKNYNQISLAIPFALLNGCLVNLSLIF